MRRIILLSGIVPVIVALPTVGLAAQLHITDCDGVTKVMYDADSAAQHRVELILAEGSPYLNSQLKVPMTNGDTGAVLERGPIGKVISYENVSAGEWKLCPMPADLALQDVRVVPTSSTDSANIAPVALGGAALIGGAIAIADSSDDDSSESGQLTELADSAGDEAPNTPVEIASNDSTSKLGNDSCGSKSPGTAAVDDSSDCRVDEEPAPISPFS